MSTTDNLIKLKKHPVVKAVPELKTLVLELEKTIMKDAKITGKYSDARSLMTDGLDYAQAMIEVGLIKP